MKTWMMQIAVNLLRNHAVNARLSSGDGPRNRASMPRCGRLAGRLPQLAESPPPAPAIASVRTAAGTVPARQRTVLPADVRRGDMDILEIAATTEVKEGTVKRTYRALETVVRIQ